MLPSASCYRQARPGTPNQLLQPLRRLAPRRRPAAHRAVAPPRAASSDDVEAEPDTFRALDAEVAAFGTARVATLRRCREAEERALEHAKACNQTRRHAQRAAPPPSARAPPPSLTGAWPPVGVCVTPAAADARTAAAEASAAAAVSFASLAAGHEAAAEAAEAAAANRPAGAPSGAAQQWELAAAAWGSVFQALQPARQADPEGSAVREAEAAVQTARRFKGRRRGLRE